MDMLTGDVHPRTRRKPSSGFTSAAARLLLRHGRREAANGESIEFFNVLRNCLPDPHISGQTAARGGAEVRGKGRRGGSGGSADEVLSLSSGIGKHDYDWLLTPPGTPPWSPATSTSGHHQVSAAVPNRLAKAGSVSHGKNNSRPGPAGLEKKSPTTSRLSNCSSAASVNNVVPSGPLLRVRTSLASSINTASNASLSSTPLRSAGSSPRTPATARSPKATATAQTCRRDKARVATSYVVLQSRVSSSKPKPGSPACTRAHPTPGVSSPRSTAPTSRQPSLTRRGDVPLARSKMASQSCGTGSTPQPRDGHQTKGEASVVPTAVRQGVVAAAITTAQRRRQFLAPAITAARNVRRENTLKNGSPRHSAGQKINEEKTKPQRTAAAAMGCGLSKTGSRKSANTTIVKRTENGNEGCRSQDGRLGGGAGGPDHRKPALLHEKKSLVTSRSRLGLIASTSKGGSISSVQRSTSASCQHAAPAAAAVSKVAGLDAFPSTRYDTMLLREDPKNLTWLRGCDEGDDGSLVGLDLVDGSHEPSDLATGLNRTASPLRASFYSLANSRRNASSMSS